jgi:cytochrome c oxidase subunit 4
MKTSLPPVTPRQLVCVYGALLVLLALTAAAARLPIGSWATPLALAIATAKAGLVFTFFMRLRERPGITRVFALAGFFWLAIILTLTLADYFTRSWRF